MKKIVLTMMLCAGILLANAQLIKNDLLTGYTVGQALEKATYPGTTQDATNPIQVNQWNLSGKTGTNNQSGTNPLTANSLTYGGYIDSGRFFISRQNTNPIIVWLQ